MIFIQGSQTDGVGVVIDLLRFVIGKTLDQEDSTQISFKSTKPGISPPGHRIIWDLSIASRPPAGHQVIDDRAVLGTP